MRFVELLIVLVFVGIINVGMIAGRIWSVDLGVLIGAVPIMAWIGGLAAHDLVRWHRGRPKPLPRAIVVRP